MTKQFNNTLNRRLNKELQQADLLLAIHELLQHAMVGTQEEISIALQQKGFVVNQVKVSRILHKLGAIKVTEDDKIVYRLPTTLVSVTPHDVLKSMILNIQHNESLIVINTSPGSAQLIARLLDQKKHYAILGTVAGDDTVLVIPETITQIQQVFQTIYQHLLG